MPVVKDNDSPPPRREAKSVPILSLPPVEESLDVFVERPEHDIHYKTLSWQFLALLMIAEIVSNGMLSLPSSLAVIGIVPAVILASRLLTLRSMAARMHPHFNSASLQIVFLGIFGLFTAKLLIDFKLNHPSVHNMGDAGFILGGPLVREVLSLGTVIFAIAGTGSELLSGQQAPSALSNNGLCAIYILLVFSFATFVIALPRTLGRLSWLGLLSVSLISLAGVVAMVGAGLNPTPSRSIRVTASTNFDQAFLAITNPVFSYAGHFMFFILISEMRHPEDAMKAAWCLQGFATIFYTVFAVVIYVNIGDNIASPAFLSLPPKWAKVSYGIALANFLIAGGLYSHTAAKLFFIRFFRHSRHMYNHTPLGWFVWIMLCFAAVAIAFIFAITVPIFSYLIGIAASLFASWYTYGLAGFFWLHDIFHLKGGRRALFQRPVQMVLAVATILAGALICISGTYVSIKLINSAYNDGLIGKPFTC